MAKILELPFVNLQHITKPKFKGFLLNLTGNLSRPVLTSHYFTSFDTAGFHLGGGGGGGRGVLAHPPFGVATNHTCNTCKSLNGENVQIGSFAHFYPINYLKRHRQIMLA